MYLLQIQPEELSVFDALPAEVQQHINRTLPVIQELFSVKSQKGIHKRKAARLLGVPFGTLNRWLGEVREEGWRALIDNRKLGTATRKVKPEFLPVWHSYVLSNQRNTKKAHQRLCMDAAQGKVIPGYADWTAWPSPPTGLSYDNLNKPCYRPTRAEVALGRQGISAARKFLPHCIQDVSELRPLELVAFDDVELDFMVQIPGLNTPVKLRMIVAFDICSRRVLGYGIRPAIPRPDGVEDGLKLRDMKAIVVRLLRTYGVPTEYPMCLLVERGTAAIPDALKQALAHVSHGQIVVSDTSMIGGKILEFRDKATGNSWGKAWLESFFNPLHGELAHLSGQKGLSYSRSPAELDGRRKELAQLVRTGRALSIEQRFELRLPFMSLEDAVTEFESALHRLDRRGEIPGTSHNLQGFDRVQLWQATPNDVPKPVSQLPEFLMDRMENLLWSSRLESPHERWESKFPLVARKPVSESGLHVLLDDQRICRFVDYQFRFEVGGTQYIYLVNDALLPRLVENQKYVLWFHSQDMNQVYITRMAPHSGYIGKLTQFERKRRGDVEAAKEQLKQTKHILNIAQERVQDARLDKIQLGAADHAANAAIYNQAAQYESERSRLEIMVQGDADELPGVAGAMLADQQEKTLSAATAKRAATQEKNLAELAEAALTELDESGY